MIQIRYRKFREGRRMSQRFALAIAACTVAMLFAFFLFARPAIGDNNVSTASTAPDAGKLPSALYASAIAETYDFKIGRASCRERV